MSLQLEPDHTVILEEDGVLAVLQRNKIEVWDAEGEMFHGILPPSASPDDVRRALRFYETGLRHGEISGAIEAQRKMRAALGL